MKKILVIFMVGFFAHPILAQEIKEELKQVVLKSFTKVNEAYKARTKLRFKMIYELTSDSAGILQTNKVEGISIISGKKRYQKIDNIEIFNHDNYFLSVNQAEQSISIASQNITNFYDMGSDWANRMLEIIDKCDSITINNEVKNYTTVHFYLSYGAYNHIAITFHNKDFLIDGIKLESYATNEKLNAKFYDFSTSQIPKDEWFSFHRFLEVKDNKLVTKPEYKDYVLFNQVLDIQSLK